MTTWTPDPTFYPSPRMAMKAPAETLAYVAAFDPTLMLAAVQIPQMQPAAILGAEQNLRNEAILAPSSR
jgi:methanethiol oxidase